MGMLNGGLVRAAESRKKYPFEPLSMKLTSVKFVPWNCTVKFAKVESTGRTTALPSPLLDCVPIPKIREPDAVVCPASGIAGSCKIVPLLSLANIHTGFCTCVVMLCLVLPHPVELHA